jgi:hypothetical protein
LAVKGTVPGTDRTSNRIQIFLRFTLQISPYVGNSTDKKITFQHLERSWTAWVESGEMLITGTSNVAEWIVGFFPSDPLGQLWFGMIAFAIGFLTQAIWREGVTDYGRRPDLPLLYQSLRQNRLCSFQPRFRRGWTAKHETRLLPHVLSQRLGPAAPPTVRDREQAPVRRRQIS